ncbi:hypothetical protein DSLASN_30190 [Desulfoluna limicola]|uniref:Uncharacterized protein n=1 Tax=Desulfoluna limicola TaxID=2810562 RepID=A0ABM7PII8_9BACT|nr:hypothetical protein DSLASN_30190 [Desulfoluna limicola]
MAVVVEGGEAATAVEIGGGAEATTVTEPGRVHMIKAPCTKCMGLFCFLKHSSCLAHRDSRAETAGTCDELED